MDERRKSFSMITAGEREKLFLYLTVVMLIFKFFRYSSFLIYGKFGLQFIEDNAFFLRNSSARERFSGACHPAVSASVS